MTARTIVLWVHRWTGLAIAGFLVAAGLSGSVLVFEHQIDERLNPNLYRTAQAGPPHPPTALAERVQSADARIRIITIPLRIAPGEAARIDVGPRLDPATGRPYPIDYDQVFIDPVSGRILGRRDSETSLLPAIREFHYTLLAPGGLGKLTMGLVAVLWTVNGFLGLYLTLPRRRPFFARWMPAFLIRRNAGFYRLNLDLHRALGLWFWGALLVLAVSSVYMNLNFELFRPVVAIFSKPTASIYERPIYLARWDLVRRHPDRVILPFDRIAVLARQRVQQAGSRGLEPSHISHFAALGVYRILFEASQFDRGPGLSRPILYLDDSDGHLVNAAFFGALSAGDRILQWQFPLHSGRIGGWPGRIFVFFCGLAVATLSATGIYLWWKNRKGRLSRLTRH